MRDPRVSYICNFDAKSSSLRRFRCLIVNESLIKSIGWLGPSLDKIGLEVLKEFEAQNKASQVDGFSVPLSAPLKSRACWRRYVLWDYEV